MRLLQRLGPPLAAMALACLPDGTSSFTSTPSTPPPMSTSEAVDSSTTLGSGAATSSAGTSSTTGSSPTTGDNSSPTTAPIFDMGIKDIGDTTPEGCKGKIDFLFVISRSPVMRQIQKKLIAAFPSFMETIEGEFASFDFHIMVVDGDPDWGLSICTDDCPLLQCKVGQPCCSVGSCPGCQPPINVGDPCCGVPGYPCELLDLVTVCDETIGAGNVFAAGADAPNEPCKMPAKDRRYLVSGDPSLVEAFSCMAQVGTSGYGLLGEAMTSALYPELNAPGGCNAGFLRDDALLMVTFIGEVDYGSKGDPASWAGTVASVKGDPGAVVFLEILTAECPPQDRICELVKMFPYHMVADIQAPDYGSIFEAATELVTTACAEYVPM